MCERDSSIGCEPSGRLSGTIRHDARTFEAEVLRPRLGPGDGRDLRTFLTKELFGTAEELEEAADGLLEGLAETFDSGEFALVVAAPVIPEGIQRVIEYLKRGACRCTGWR